MLEKLYNKIKSENIKGNLPDFFYDLLKIDKKLSNNEFFCKVIEDILEKDIQKPEIDHNKLKLIQLFLQHFTSYDNKCGTLLKTIAILPLFAECGFNSIMLLPHFMRSEKFKKGDKGSPYSVKDYYTIDNTLNEFDDISTHDIFKAFIEACHRLGIMVFIDMVPRTAARDSLWILENPDWFYWIKPENSDKLVKLLQTPVPGIGSPAPPTREFGKTIIENLPVSEIADLFSLSPKQLYPEKWQIFVEKHKNNSDFLDELVKEFGIITPPCTSDCANDPQPPWSDVTPLRLYEDYDPLFYDIFGKENIDRSAPFFIQPILKASVFFGNRPNIGLWKKISGVCEYYANEFNVDGVRGDMFHALPDQLIKDMVSKVPEKFVLIMENLFNDEGEELSLKHNFHFYTGNLFTVVDEGRDAFNYFIKQTESHKTDILAMPVIGDSMPLFGKGKEIAEFQIYLSAFLNNSAYGLTADTLIYNDLPLNFGLGFSENDQKRLKIKMKEHNRDLAYFNNDYLTECWNNMKIEKINIFKNLIDIREDVFENNNWKLNSIDNIDHYGLVYSFISDKNTKITIIANFSHNNEVIELSVNNNEKAYDLLNSVSENNIIRTGALGITIVTE